MQTNLPGSVHSQTSSEAAATAVHGRCHSCQACRTYCQNRNSFHFRRASNPFRRRTEQRRSPDSRSSWASGTDSWSSWSCRRSGKGNHHELLPSDGKGCASSRYKLQPETETWPAASLVYGTWLDGSGTKPVKQCLGSHHLFATWYCLVYCKRNQNIQRDTVSTGQVDL